MASTMFGAKAVLIIFFRSGRLSCFGAIIKLNLRRPNIMLGLITTTFFALFSFAMKIFTGARLEQQETMNSAYAFMRFSKESSLKHTFMHNMRPWQRQLAKDANTESSILKNLFLYLTSTMVTSVSSVLYPCVILALCIWRATASD